MTLGSLLVRKPDEAQFTPYEDLDPLTGGSTIVVPAKVGTRAKRGKVKAAVILDLLEGETQFTERLEVRGEVASYFQIEPKMIDLGDLQPGEAPSATVTIQTGDGARVALDGSNVETPGFVTTLLAVAPDQYGRASEWKLSVSPDGTVKSGFGYAVPTWTSDVALARFPGEFQSLSVSCKYRVSAPLEVSNNFVSFGLIRSAQAEMTRTVTLRANDLAIHPLAVIPTFQREVGQPASWSDGVQLRVLPSDVEGEAILEVKLPERPTNADGSFRGRIVLDSGVEGVEPVHIHFTGVCRF